MKLSEALQGLGRPVAFYPELARCLGSVPAAIFLAQLIYWRGRQRHVYLFKTAAELELETGLSAKTQRTARTLLKRLGILEDRYARLQHETHFWLHLERLDDAWKRFEQREASAQTAHGQTPKGHLDEATKGRMAKRRKGASIPETTQRLRLERTQTPSPLTFPKGNTCSKLPLRAAPASLGSGKRTGNALKDRKAVLAEQARELRERYPDPPMEEAAL